MSVSGGPSRTLRLSDGRQLGWAEYGAPDGKPMLGFHGAPACRLMLEPADVPARELGLRIIAADRPGYGLSSPQHRRSLADWAEDVRALLDHLGVARAPVLAISGGCPYAVVAADRLGGRITGLGLVSPLGEVAAANAGALMSRGQRAFFQRLPKAPALLRGAAGVARAAFMAAPELTYRGFAGMLTRADRQVLASPVARRLVIGMTREALRDGLEGALSDLALYARPWGVQPADVTCPAVLWQGTADHIVPAELAFELGRRLACCQVHRLEGHGHFWVIEHVREVLGTVAGLGKA